MRQRGERASGIPLVAALGHGLENARLAAARVFTSGVFTTGILTAGFSPPGFSPPDSHRRGFASGVFTTGILTAGFSPPGFSPPILATGLFLRDGQIDGVGALLKRHVEEGGFGDRAGELTVNSPSEVKMR